MLLLDYNKETGLVVNLFLFQSMDSALNAAFDLEHQLYHELIWTFLIPDVLSWAVKKGQLSHVTQEFHSTPNAPWTLVSSNIHLARLS